MIFHLLRKRRPGGPAQAERIRLSADQFITAWGGDLHTAFWRAHDRAQDPAMPREERSVWRALVEEIDRRRPALAPRADTATRRLFPDRRS